MPITTRSVNAYQIVSSCSSSGWRFSSCSAALRASS